MVEYTEPDTGIRGVLVGHDGFDLRGWHCGIFCDFDCIRVCLRPLALRWILGVESSVLLGVCVLLMIYLGYALLRPEKF